MPKIDVPKGARTPEERKKIAEALCLEIDESIRECKALKERWDRNEALYRNEDGILAVQICDSIPARHIPVVQPKIDEIVGETYISTTSISPMVQGVPASGDTETADKIERDLETLLSKGQFDTAWWQALETSAICGHSWLRPRIEFHDPNFLPLSGDLTAEAYSEESQVCAGLVVDYGHPNDLVLYPSHRPKLTQAKTVGFRMPYLRAVEVRELQEVGRYLNNVTIYGGDDAEEYESGRSVDYDLYRSGLGTGEPDDQTVEMYELYTKLKLADDKFERWYQVVVAKTQTEILLIKPWPYSRHPIFALRLKPEPGKFRPSGSIAQNMQGSQLSINDISHLITAGSAMAAIPAMIVPQGGLQQKMTKYNPGDVIESDSPEQVQYVSTGFNPGELFNMLDYYEKKADASARISRIGTSEQLTPGTTATEANALIQSQDAAKNQYSAFASLTLQEMWPYILELYKRDFTYLKEIYGDELEIESEDQLSIRLRWEVAGKTSNNTPEALLQKLQFLLNMVAQDPASEYDKYAVVNAIVSALNLPFRTDALKKGGIDMVLAELQQIAINTGLQGPDLQALQELLVAVVSGQLPPGAMAALMTMLKEAAGGQPSGANGGMEPAGQMQGMAQAPNVSEGGGSPPSVAA